MLILSITGAYLVFAEDIEHAFGDSAGPQVFAVVPGSDTPLQDSVDRLAARHPEAKLIGVRPVEPGEAQYVLTFLEGADTLHRYVFDPDAGEVRTEVESTITRINHFILHLHADLFLGFLGVVFLGFISILFLLSTVSGIIIYAPFMKQAAFGALRLDRGLRRASADIHKLVGASALVFNLIIAVTGIALTLGFLGARMWAANEVRMRTAAAGTGTDTAITLPPIDEVLLTAAAVHPGAPVSSIVMPGGFQGPGHYFMFHQLPGPLSKFVPVYSLVAAATPGLGEAVEVPLWIDLLMISVPLHFGNYGGILLKLAYCLLALGSGVLTVTGAVISLSRWRKRWRQRRRLPGRTHVAGAPETAPRTVDA